MGQHDEAELALKAYLELVEINSKVKSADDDTVLTHEQRIRQDIESERDIATVMVEGSHLYGKELGKPTEALDCADRALDTIHKHLQVEEAQELLFNAYNYQGIAYALLASQGMCDGSMTCFMSESMESTPILLTKRSLFLLAHEPEKRPALFAKAVESHEKAIQVSSEAFEGHYYLALQLAETREVPKAIAAVKQSLNLNAAHIPSWHLLVLLLSSQKDYERALSVSSVGLKESEWDLPNTDGFSASQLDGEDYLALRITQAALQDQLQGPEAALEQQEALFVLYTKVFAPEPSSIGESLYDIQNIRRRDQSDIEQGSTIVGRPRAGSILSVRSRSGASDVGQSLSGSNSNLGKSC
jgi:tetratricopeptide (TPR) repeat protein